MSPWRQMSCPARKGGLRQVDDDVAETHWQRKVCRHSDMFPAWQEVQIIKAHFLHFRGDLPSILERE